jgi:hypothetical protein
MNDRFAKARRKWLKRMAAGGVMLGAGGIGGWISRALANGDLGGKQGIVRLDGSATVDGKSAREGSVVALGQRVTTGPKSQAVLVIGKDAFLMRADTIIETTAHEGVLSNLLISTGKVLSVFSKKPLAIRAANATIGIRGTGAYVEVEPAEVYFCLCYGEAVVQGPGMADKLVETTHHEHPLLLRESNQALAAQDAGFRNHTDAELIMLEALVGREPPFLKDGKVYPAGKYG